MEWWQFVLPLVGSALGGALVTGFFGWRKRHWDRDDEHARWVRDKKQEAYVEFIEDTRRALNAASSYGDSSHKTDQLAQNLDAAVDAIRGAPIHLIGSREVRVQALLVRDHVDELVNLAWAARSPEEWEESQSVVRTMIEASRLTLTENCRADLETDDLG